MRKRDKENIIGGEKQREKDNKERRKER